MLTLVYDTETTGLFVSDVPEDHIRQPWPIQLGAILLDENMKIVEYLDVLVKPHADAEFQPDAVKVHGFTKEFVMANGKDMVENVTAFANMASHADLITGYNVRYDNRIMQSTAARIALPDPFPPATKMFCIMDLVQRKFERRMRLGDAFKLLTGRPVKRAHNALADTLTAAEVLRRIMLRTQRERPGVNLSEA